MKNEMIEKILNMDESLKIKTQEYNNRFTDLAPIDNITDGRDYISDLKWGLDHSDRIKNIAITGPYGSGKSSIINSYLKKYPLKREKSLNISLAMFSNGNENKPFSEDDIQRSVLKQIFYKTEPSKIPLSRYRKLYKPKYWKIVSFVMLFFIIFLGIEYIFDYKMWTKNLKLIVNAYDRLIQNGFGLIICIVLFSMSISIIYLIPNLISYLISRFSISKINLGNMAEADKDTDSSVFDKNMDEIMYFFENTKYEIVFFEDLDRWKDNSIFIHLRELNLALNKDDSIKRPIRFVYAIGDDFFNDKEERTKFFDFIIPVIPIMTATNAGEMLLKKVNNSKEAEGISKEFIFDVSPYIPNIRILNNIFNEFKIYEPIIIEKQKLQLSKEKLLALILFKNLFPRIFAQLENEDGIVKEAFNKKAEYVQKLRGDIQSKIITDMKEIELLKNEALENYKELVSAFLVEVTSYKGLATTFNFYGGDNFSADDLLNKKINLDSYANEEISSVYYTSINYGGNAYRLYSSDLNNFNDIVNSYVSRINLINENKNDSIKKFQNDIENQKKEKEKLSLASLKELLEKNTIIGELPKDVKENNLLVFLLRRGYIDEQYSNYINYFKATSITAKDQNFILSIKNRKKLSQDYYLTRIENIVSRLQDFEFQQKEIYNNYLLDYLLASNKKSEIKKLDIFIKQLTDETEESWNFIEGYLPYTNNEIRQRFIEKISRVWPDMFNFIQGRIDISGDQLVKYLGLILTYANVDAIQKMNSNKLISEYLSSHKNSLQKLANTVGTNKMEQILKAIPVKFSDESLDQIDPKLINYIIDNENYEINWKMLYAIADFINPELQKNFNFHVYTNLLRLGNESPVIRYVLAKENLQKFINNIVLSKSNIEEEPNAIKDLLQRAEDESVRERILQHEIYIFDELDELGKSYWDIVLKYDRVSATWNNVNKYWNEFKFTKELVEFLHRNINKIVECDASACTADFKLAFTRVELDNISDYITLISCLEFKDVDFDISSIPDQNLKIMVEQDKIEFSVQKYIDIENVDLNIAVEFILRNQAQVLRNFSDFNFDEEILKRLLKSPRITSKFVSEVIEQYEYLYHDITDEIAGNLFVQGISYNLNWFFAIWKYLTNDQKQEWMIKYMDFLHLHDFIKCFSEITGKLNEFKEKLGTAKEVRLSNNCRNVKLANRLKKVGYITSYKTKESYLRLKLKKGINKE